LIVSFLLERVHEKCVELRGFEPLTSCMPYKYIQSVDVARRRSTSSFNRSMSLTIALHRRSLAPRLAPRPGFLCAAPPASADNATDRSASLDRCPLLLTKARQGAKRSRPSGTPRTAAHSPADTRCSPARRTAVLRDLGAMRTEESLVQAPVHRYAAATKPCPARNRRSAPPLHARR
jgi:hypothetical protein